MIIITQNEVATAPYPWWSKIYIEPESKLEILLGQKESDLTLRVAKFRSKKRTAALYQAIATAIENEQRIFNVNKWLVEYSLQESSKTASKSP